MSTWATGIEVFDAKSGTLITEIDKGNGDYDYSLMTLVYFFKGRNGSSVKIPSKLQMLEVSVFPELLKRLLVTLDTVRPSDSYVAYKKSDINDFDLSEVFSLLSKNYETGQFEESKLTYREYLDCERVEQMLSDIKKSEGDTVVFWYNP